MFYLSQHWQQNGISHLYSMYLALAFINLCMLSKTYGILFRIRMYGVFEFAKINFYYCFVLLRKAFQKAGQLSKV